MATIQNEDEWDIHLHKVKMSINNAKSSATGHSPNELFFGYQPVLPENSHFLHAIDVDDEHADTIPEEVKNFKDLRLKLQAQAVEKNKENQEKTALRFIDRKPAEQFKVGDYVLLPNTNPSSKLKERQKGPYIIIQVLPYDRYLVENASSLHRKYRSIHSAEHLKKIVLTRKN